MSDRPLRILAADDERMSRKRLERLLTAMPEVDLLGVLESGEEVLAALDEEPADILVLDIDMPGLSGLETKALLGSDGPTVIFATAHPEHALEAFDVGAVDYVLKPLDADRLKRAVERAAGRRAEMNESAAAPASGGPSRLALPTRDGARLLDPDAISHAVFDGQLVTVHCGGEALLTEQSLTDLEKRLPAGRFERVHRRALVNLARVDRLIDQPTGGYVAVTDGGAQVEVSRMAARRLRKRLGLR